jgi:hypothetical protein
MAFRCPQCGQTELEVAAGVRVEANVELQVVSCSCGFAGLAVFEDGGTAWGHRGYRASTERVLQIRAALETCPLRRPPCSCAIHTAYAQSRFGGLLEGEAFAIVR